MNNEEIWKNVKNYEGLYEVSNLGRVKSKDRKFGNKHNNHVDNLEWNTFSENNKHSIAIGLRPKYCGFLKGFEAIDKNKNRI